MGHGVFEQVFVELVGDDGFVVQATPSLDRGGNVAGNLAQGFDSFSHFVSLPSAHALSRFRGARISEPAWMLAIEIVG